MAATILLVDDSMTILNLLAMGLRQSGYNVQTASDGRMALDIVQRQQVDLIITDINMPRMDGITLISHVRSMKRMQRVPIIILSTEADQLDRERGLNAGANCYLNKPIANDELVANVKQLLY